MSHCRDNSQNQRASSLLHWQEHTRVLNKWSCPSDNFSWQKAPWTRRLFVLTISGRGEPYTRVRSTLTVMYPDSCTPPSSHVVSFGVVYESCTSITVAVLRQSSTVLDWLPVHESFSMVGWCHTICIYSVLLFSIVVTYTQGLTETM